MGLLTRLLDLGGSSVELLPTLVPMVGVHPFPLQELMLMAATVCRFQPSLIFEWGTNIGKSARIFHEIARYFHIRTTIHACDLPDDVDHVEHPHAQRGAMVRGLEGVQLHQGDGLTTSLGLCERAGRPPSPLFFLDGDHSHASVRREIDGILAAYPGRSQGVHSGLSLPGMSLLYSTAAAAA